MRSEADAKEVGINRAVNVAGLTHLSDGFQWSSAGSDPGVLGLDMNRVTRVAKLAKPAKKSANKEE